MTGVQTCALPILPMWYYYKDLKKLKPHNTKMHRNAAANDRVGYCTLIENVYLCIYLFIYFWDLLKVNPLIKEKFYQCFKISV